MKRKIAFFSIFLIAANIFALGVPELNERVCDYGGILNARQKVEITDYLERLEQTSGIQIGVLTVPSLKGDSIERFSMKAAEKWKLGQNKKDNGALLVVALAERKMRIEVGYGLEDKLTDTKCGLILRNVVAPAFRNGNYGLGIYDAVRNMGGIASDNAELVANNVAKSDSDDEDDFMSLFYGLFFVIGWIILFSNISRRRNFGWLPWFLFFNSMGGGSNYHHSGSGGFSSRSSGGSRNSFSGGGGHFGGGGASSGW